MTRSHRRISAAIAGSAFALTLASLVAAVPFEIQPAFAKSGNGNGNGNGNSNANAGGNGSGNAGGNASGAANVAATGPGNSGNAPRHITVKSVEFASATAPDALGAFDAKGKSKSKAGGLDADIGALHAVHANLQAFLHASPNSRIGRIAAYAKATIAVEGAEKTLADAEIALAAAQTALADATAAFQGSADLANFAALYPATYPNYDLATLHDRLMALSASVVPLTLGETAELTALTSLLSSPSATALTSALATTSGLADAVAADQAAVDAAATEATNALAAAGNKPITDAVRAYVDAALQGDGVLDYYRAQ